MSATLVREADPPLATIISEGEPAIAGYSLGDFDPLDFSEDFLVDWYSFDEEEDPGPGLIDVEPEPVFAGWGIFDIDLFDVLLFDTGEGAIDDDPPPVAIMVEAEP